MSVLELHPELETFVGNNYGKTGGTKVLYYGESHFLPNNKGETFSDEVWYNNTSKDLGLSDKDIGWINTKEIIRNDVIDSPLKDKSHSMYRNIGNVHGEALNKGDYRTALDDLSYGNYFKRPAETTGGSIKVTEMDKEVAYDAFKKDLETLKPDKIAFSSKKAYEAAIETANKRGDNKILQFLKERAVVVPHATSAWWNRISKAYGGLSGKERLIQFLRDPKGLPFPLPKAPSFLFSKPVLITVLILVLLLLVFLLFRNCSFESQQEPTVQTVVETKVTEPTKEEWNTEKVTAVKSSFNGCETLTNATNFKDEWEKNLENAKTNEAKQIVIPSVGVLFELGSSVVSEDGSKLIQEFANAYLQTNKEATVLIESYTCDIGTDESNMTLSNDRANVIKAVLGNMGITSVEVKSYGESTYNSLNCKSKEEHRRGNISIK